MFLNLLLYKTGYKEFNSYKRWVCYRSYNIRLGTGNGIYALIRILEHTLGTSRRDEHYKGNSRDHIV